jgi:hypothetical protein
VKRFVDKLPRHARRGRPLALGQFANAFETVGFDSDIHGDRKRALLTSSPDFASGRFSKNPHCIFLPRFDHDASVKFIRATKKRGLQKQGHKTGRKREMCNMCDFDPDSDKLSMKN